MDCSRCWVLWFNRCCASSGPLCCGRWTGWARLHKAWARPKAACVCDQSTAENARLRVVSARIKASTLRWNLSCSAWLLPPCCASHNKALPKPWYAPDCSASTPANEPSKAVSIGACNAASKCWAASTICTLSLRNAATAARVSPISAGTCAAT